MSRKRGWIWLGNGLGTSQLGGSRRQGKRRRCAHIGGRSFGHQRRRGCEPLEERRLLSITVDTLVDEADGSIVDGDISLRDAIALAPAGETIDFAESLSGGTITLTLGELVIDKSLTIDGPGADQLTIDASGNDPTPDSTLDDGDDTNDGDGSRVFRVTANELSVYDLILTGGDVVGSGGAVWASGDVILTRSTVSGNAASGNRADGGGISADGKVMMDQSVVSGNATSGGVGGGIFSDNFVSLVDTTVSNNVSRGGGGGIWSNRRVSMTNCDLIGNSTGGLGGGAFSGDATMYRTTVSGNTAGYAGGGIVVYFTYGESLLVDSTISDNYSGGVGGGIGIFAPPFGSTVLTRCTVSGNHSADAGGGIYSYSKAVILNNSTISGNSADGPGGGMRAPKVVLRQSTVTDNSTSVNGGGIWSALGTTLDHTVVAGNVSSGGTRDDVLGGITARYSLIGDDTGALITDNGGNLIGTFASPIDPRLEPLQNNGGPTQTHALLPGSPAIDAGDPGFGGPLVYDQRGAPFARVVGAAVDIGAYETQSLALVVDTLADESDGDYSAGDLSLREAIELANANPGADTIGFDESLSGGTILLTMGELAVTDSVDINGPGAELLTIDASGNDPTPDSTYQDGDDTNDGDGSRVFNVDDGDFNVNIDVTLGGLTLTGGDVDSIGGAIRSVESLTIADTTITGNTATDYGGGVFAATHGYGTATIIRSAIMNNASDFLGGGIFLRASDSGNNAVIDSVVSNNSSVQAGGGIYCNTGDSGETTISHTTVSGNSSDVGGGIWSLGNDLNLVRIFDTNISYNDARQSGGGVRISSTTIDHSSLVGNSAGRFGGGIYVAGHGGESEITHSNVSNNTATDRGGGIAVLNEASISYTSVVGNTSRIGGGISSTPAAGRHVNIDHSTITENSATIGAGGIGAEQNASISNSTVSRNSSQFGGGGIAIGPNSTITRSTIADNAAGAEGGGVLVNLSSSSAATISQSTITGNSAYRGGGVRATGNVTITNSTVSDNSATYQGGGVDADDAVTVSHSTVAGNVAYGLGDGSKPDDYAGGGVLGNPSLDHTIVAGNTRRLTVRDDVYGEPTASYSLIGDDTGATITDNGGNLIGTAASPIDPLLGPLADNGGPTMTHALLPGSPAIDAGNPSFVPPPEFDQRGAPFARVAGAAIDIGAYEVQPPTVQELLDQYVADGVLNHGQANSLWVKLAFRGNELAKPKRQQAFVNHVNAFVHAGILSDEQGQALIAALDSPGAPVSGDYNGDGVVNGLDYIVWASNYGASVTDSVARQRAALDAVLTEPEDTVVPLQLARSVASGNDTHLSLHVRLALDHAFDTWAVKKREK